MHSNITLHKLRLVNSSITLQTLRCESKYYNAVVRNTHTSPSAIAILLIKITLTVQFELFPSSLAPFEMHIIPHSSNSALFLSVLRRVRLSSLVLNSIVYHASGTAARIAVFFILSGSCDS